MESTSTPNTSTSSGVVSRINKKTDSNEHTDLTNCISYGTGIVESADDEILRQQGHDAVLERSTFNIWAALGLAFSVTGSWVGYLSCFGQNLLYGGPQTVVFALLVATFVQIFITLGLSELASCFPSTGGQYHYVYLVAPRRFRQPLAFFTGWFSVLGWWIVTCSGHLLVAVSISGLAQFYHTTYVSERWHVYLLYLATAFVTSAPVFLCPKKIGWFTQSCLYLSISGCLVVLIMALAMHQQWYPSERLLRSDLGTSGWSSSWAWVLAIGNSMYAYVGTDAASHVAEEMPHPNKRVPSIMNGSIIIGFFTVFPLFLALMYGMTDMDAVTSSALPSLEIFHQVTGSKIAAGFMQAWVLIVYINSLNAQWVTSGRIVWALARDGGVPFAKYFSHVDEKRVFPLRSTLLAGAFICIYGVIYLASTNAFNSIVTSAVLYLNMSYTIPQAVVVCRGRKILPNCYMSLGPIVGYFCNIFSIVAVLALIVIYSFPATNPTTLGSMNYSSVVLVGLSAILTGLWLGIGKNFQGPGADLESMVMFAHDGSEA
ncbi:amino acid transporter [Lophiostoma macrostomum CBS 122681]|uniref:Amino acid transporter n=1 Tax=Lophiostoma macrostomum CBS 122681 TaxID=1314788 RepID=A0A6A6TTH4_9PLEO|nr:amino acid transporter [Lophiostoma macrostomum CBS 122681]